MPYAETALAPVLSARAVHLHRRKQERYVTRTRELVRRTTFSDLTLGQVVRESERQILADDAPAWMEDLFEQASQAWNHALMWRSMAPPDRRPPTPAWARELEAQWKDEAASVFASGWVWLCLTHDGDPEVVATADADRPSGRPLAVMDVWEHAYYLDYPDQKQRYVDLWWDRLADWSVAEQILRGQLPQELR